MVRHSVHARTSFAASGAPGPGEQGDVRQSTARVAVKTVRLIAAPFALVGAAIAGVIFAALLPICGIATICEGFAKASWRFVRDTFSRVPHVPARRS